MDAGQPPEEKPAGRHSGPSREVLEAIGVLPAPADDGPRRLSRLRLLGAALAVVLTWAALVLWGLEAIPFHTQDEPREALVVRAMAHGGSWILPSIAGDEVPLRPGLLHWLAASAAAAHGAVDECSVRLPSAVAALLASLLVLGAGARLWSVRAGMFAALVLLTNVAWLHHGTTARIEIQLALTLEIALLSLLFFVRSRNPRWLIPFYGGVALAWLDSGLVGIAVPAATAIAVCLISRDVTPLQQLRLFRGGLAVALLAAAWTALSALESGQDLVIGSLFEFAPSARSSGAPPSRWIVALDALAAFLPWTLLLPAAAIRLWRQRSELRAQDGAGFLVTWGVVVLGIFAASGAQHPVLLLTLCPVAALLIGDWTDRVEDEGKRPATGLRWVLLPVAPLVAAGTLFAGLVSGAWMLGLPAEAWLAEVLAPRDALGVESVRAALQANIAIASIGTVLMIAGAMSLLACARQPRAPIVFAALFALACGAGLLLRQGVLPGVATAHTQREFMRAARALIEPDHNPFFHECFDYGALYYGGGRIPVYQGPWPGEGPRYIIKTQRSWARQRPMAVHHYDSVRDASGAVVESNDLILLRRRDPSQP